MTTKCDYNIEGGEDEDESLLVSSRCPICKLSNPHLYTIVQECDIDEMGGDLENYEIIDDVNKTEAIMKKPFLCQCLHCGNRYAYNIEITARVKNIREFDENEIFE